MMARRIGLAAALLFVAACSSSGGDGTDNNNDGCVEALPGCETAVCVGNYVRTCSEDGLHYEYELCYGKRCADGMCQDAGCLEPGRKECDPTTGPGAYNLCVESMTQYAPKECPAATKCSSGACVDVECTAGDIVCGWQAVLTCKEDGTGWDVTECGESQYCDDTSLACVDVDPFCQENPLGSRCQDLENALQCDNKGKVSVVECGSKEVCQEGFCQPMACGISYEAGTPTDTVSAPDSTLEDIVSSEIEELVTVDINIPKDVPPLDPVPKAWCTLNGGEFDNYEIKFTSAREANYVVKDKDLQVTMAKGVNLMEVHFQGIEEGVVGNFSSEEPGSVNVWIVFNDGTTDQEVVQWKWQSVAFDATLDQFDPADGWVKGSFAGVLEMDPNAGTGDPVQVLNGYFEVPRKQ